MDKRKIKISENLDGHGTVGYRISLPKKWIAEIFDKDIKEKYVELKFDGEKIIIEKY